MLRTYVGLSAASGTAAAVAAAITARRFARCMVGGSAAVAGTATAELLYADRFAAAARAACIAHVVAVPSKPPGYSFSSIATPPPKRTQQAE